MDWKSYENITKEIYETLGKSSGVEILGYGNTCKIKGKSGIDHQIDVLTKHSDGVHSYLTAIECKCWDKKVTKDVVMKMAVEMEDAGIDKGVIVSKSGFTADCISTAKYKNIGLVELRESLESENPTYGLIDINTELRRPIVSEIHILIEGENPCKVNDGYNNMSIVLSDGSSITLNDIIMKFKNELHNEDPFKQVKKSYDFSGSKLIDGSRKTELPLTRIGLIGMLTILNSKLVFNIVDQVWLIMKVHFENKTFAISERIDIREI